jgi:hypothetical protein
VITLTPTDDLVLEGPESVAVTIVAGTGYLPGAPEAASIELRDNEPVTPVVSIVVGNSLAAEATPIVQGQFVIWRSIMTASPLTVYYRVRPASTATSGSDYNALTGSVTIPANHFNAEVIVTPRDDTIHESSETVILGLLPDANYELYGIASGTVTIADNDPGPDVVTITASDPDAAEPGTDTGTFLVARTNPQSSLTVQFNVGGTASSGVDYSSLGPTVVIPAGSLSSPITVTPINDTTTESDETVVVTLAAAAGYTVGSPNAATVTIHDDNDCSPVQVRRLTHNGRDRTVLVGDTVTYTAVTRPRNPTPGHGAYTWQFRELLLRTGNSRSYAPWLFAFGTRDGNTLVVTENTPRRGQYRVTLASCNAVTTASISIGVVPPPKVDLTAYRPQPTRWPEGVLSPFNWGSHRVPEERADPTNNETNPGAGIRINGDNDNGNTDANGNPIRDRDDGTARRGVVGENDLIRVSVTMPRAPSGVDYYLVRENLEIRVWKDSSMTGTPYFQDDLLLEEKLQRPATPTGSIPVWVEFPGPVHGSSVLELQARDGAQVLSRDQVRFYSFRSLVIALGGEDDEPTDPAVAGRGTFDIAIRLYDLGYDVHMYDEDRVHPGPFAAEQGSGRPYDEVVSAVQNREVTQVAIFGYSHGGGKTYVLAERLTNNATAIGRPFTIPYTAYIDAIKVYSVLCENRMPPVPNGSNRQHSNYYQRNLAPVAPFRGCPIPGSAPDRDHSATENHKTIDDEELVKQGTEGVVVQLLNKVKPQ